MDPLVRLRRAREAGGIPAAVCDLVERRFPAAVAGINRIERASGLRFPPAYVEPSLVVTAPDPGSYGYGILFARTIPVASGGRFEVIIQVSAPLVAYGLRGTVHAILAHEFLHYLELMGRISRMGIVSDEVSASVFGGAHADSGRLLEPGAVFRDRTLLGHITRRFPAGFRDRRLEDKAVRLWAGRGLPRTDVSLDSNTVRLPAEALSRIRLDPGFASALAELEERSERIRRRRR